MPRRAAPRLADFCSLNDVQLVGAVNGACNQKKIRKKKKDLCSLVNGKAKFTRPAGLQSGSLKLGNKLQRCTCIHPRKYTERESSSLVYRLGNEGKREEAGLQSAMTLHVIYLIFSSFAACQLQRRVKKLKKRFPFFLSTNTSERTSERTKVSRCDSLDDLSPLFFLLFFLLESASANEGKGVDCKTVTWANQHLSIPGHHRGGDDDDNNNRNDLLTSIDKYSQTRCC